MEINDWKFEHELRDLYREEEEKIMGKATFWLVLSFAVLFVVVKIGSRQT